ncbi:MAG: SDR family NAD(P)-dependent oxidoreductase [Caedimonadaceae bacterium]|nr:MAG: SDR family NAD(P)-dependent oxidoreductase [Caedimonadaceae bacterium]
MIVFITGAAGFIGYHVAEKLLKEGTEVIGCDNLNDYYDVSLKIARLERLKRYPNFSFYPLDITSFDALKQIMTQHPNITHTLHLAAQAGVRHSLIDPFAYARSNILGHLNLLEALRSLQNLEHFVYASSSSVYGANEKQPFSTEDRVDQPLSLYAATKRAGELMSYCYSHLYPTPTTGLRYFTVYGPWGRPDMSSFIFTEAMLNDREIPVFNDGDMSRNFTYIDDVVAGTLACLKLPVTRKENPLENHRIYNIGNDRSEKLMDFIHVLEKTLGIKAKIRLEPMQKGDVRETTADISSSKRDFNYAPHTSIGVGIPQFVAWYLDYFKISKQNNLSTEIAS